MRIKKSLLISWRKEGTTENWTHTYLIWTLLLPLPTACGQELSKSSFSRVIRKKALMLCKKNSLSKKNLKALEKHTKGCFHPDPLWIGYQ